MLRRQCSFRHVSGEPCRAPPMRDSEYCFWHSPEHVKDVQEARRLGGLRRKREITVAGAYDIESLSNVEGIRRLVEIAVLDTLGMDNSLSRNRTLGYLAQVALRTLEVGELEQRIAILEQSVYPPNLQRAPPVFDIESSAIEDTSKEKI